MTGDDGDALFPIVRNRLLRALPRAELKRLWPRLEAVEMPSRSIVMASDAPIDAVHFVEEGVTSLITTLADGSQIEVGIAGPEGFVGVPLLLGVSASFLDGVVQIEGSALRLSASNFRAALIELPSLMPLLLRYVDTIHNSLAQTAACNGRHRIDERLARWTLMTHDRVAGDDFRMTQEFLSTMLGVRRPGVTLALQTLQRAGLVQHDHGQMRVLDRDGLEAACCGCYLAMRDRFRWLMEPKQP